MKYTFFWNPREFDEEREEEEIVPKESVFVWEVDDLHIKTLGFPLESLNCAIESTFTQNIKFDKNP